VPSFKIEEDRESYYRVRGEGPVIISEGKPELREEWNNEPDPEETFDAEQIFAHNDQLINVTPSMFVEFAVMMPDKKTQRYVPFTFDKREYLRQVYDTGFKRTLLKCGRQVEKSTLLGNKLLAYSCIIPSLNSLYVSPTNQQTKVFSQDRLKEPIETSQFLKSWTTTKLSDNVFLKKFINRSQITLRYAYLNADRTRGIPADLVCIDEIQDVLTDNIPVIEECASHSELTINGLVHKGGLFMYSGTPKSLDNTLEYYWVNYSTQNEWAVPCHRHAIMGPDGKMSKVYWNILTEDHIGVKHLICDKCGGKIDPQDPMAKWVSLHPDVANPSSSAYIPKPYEGYRIPQLMVPWISHDDLRQKQKTYTRDKFHNEVLGLSYDSGTRPLTQQDLRDNCSDHFLLTPAFLARLKEHCGESIPIYAGIDWGTGENTYTIMTMAAYLDGYFTPFYWHRFEGREVEPVVQMEMIEKLISDWKVRLVGCDYGGGFDRNDTLTRKFGWQRIVKYQYSTPNDKVRWDQGLKRFLVHRTEVMSDIFNGIKRRTVFKFPNWEQFRAPFGSDFLNIFSEYSETLRMNVYKKSPDSTDDSFHALLLCFLASMIQIPRPDVIAPDSSPNEPPVLGF